MKSVKNTLENTLYPKVYPQAALTIGKCDNTKKTERNYRRGTLILGDQIQKVLYFPEVDLQILTLLKVPLNLTLCPF